MQHHQEQIKDRLTSILARLSEAGREALLSFVLCGFSDEVAMKEAVACVEEMDRYDESAMAGWILGSIGTTANGITASALEECLQDLLCRDMTLLTEEKRAVPGVLALNKFPLHRAAESGDLDIVKQLVDKGMSPDIQNSKGLTPLHCAAAAGKLHIVQWLINEGGATPDIGCYEDGKTPLHLAAKSGAFEIVQWLIDVVGVDPDIKDKEGRSPLHSAASGGLEIVKWLVDTKGTNPNIKDHGGLTPLHTAALYGHLDIAQWLVDEKGIPPGIEDSQGKTPLHYAAESGALDIVQWLIDEKGVAPYIKDIEGRTPLYYARNAVEPSPTLYYLVAKKRAPLDSEDDDYATLVRYAIAAGNLDIVKWLVDKGSTQNADNETRELLNAAAFYGHLHIIKWLVEE
ncbi:MAG: ankyrin repeat domain-containing protein [bacterium]